MAAELVPEPRLKLENQQRWPPISKGHHVAIGGFEAEHLANQRRQFESAAQLDSRESRTAPGRAAGRHNIHSAVRVRQESQTDEPRRDHERRHT